MKDQLPTDWDGNAMKQGRWRLKESEWDGRIAIDSGAADSVMPRHEAGMLFPLLPKKEGVRFCAANGQTIQNYGRRNVAFKTEGSEWG